MRISIRQGEGNTSNTNFVHRKTPNRFFSRPLSLSLCLCVVFPIPRGDKIYPFIYVRIYRYVEMDEWYETGNCQYITICLKIYFSISAGSHTQVNWRGINKRMQHTRWNWRFEVFRIIIIIIMCTDCVCECGDRQATSTNNLNKSPTETQPRLCSAHNSPRIHFIIIIFKRNERHKTKEKSTVSLIECNARCYAMILQYREHHHFCYYHFTTRRYSIRYSIYYSA